MVSCAATGTALGYSQTKLAEVVGVHRTYVGAFERGKRSVHLNLIKSAQALEVWPGSLFPG